MIDQPAKPMLNECFCIGLLSSHLPECVLPGRKGAELICPGLGYNNRDGQDVADAKQEVAYPVPVPEVTNDNATLPPSTKAMNRK